jgi:solute carrier family 25 phosphate transporter 3
MSALKIPIPSKEDLKKYPFGKIEPNSTKYFLACMAGGLIACGPTHTSVAPLDLVKTRRQVDPKLYSGNFSAWKAIYGKEGLRGVFFGWSPTFVGYSFQGLGKYGFYEVFKHEYGDNLFPNANKTLVYLGASASAEFLADILLCPWEAIKVRMQTTIPPYANNLREGWSKIVAKEGIAGLYKGITPLWGRQIPYTMCKFASFEETVKLIYKQLGKPKESYNKVQQTGVSFLAGGCDGVEIERGSTARRECGQGDGEDLWEYWVHWTVEWAAYEDCDDWDFGEYSSACVLDSSNMPIDCIPVAHLRFLQGVFGSTDNGWTLERFNRAVTIQLGRQGVQWVEKPKILEARLLILNSYGLQKERQPCSCSNIMRVARRGGTRLPCETAKSPGHKLAFLSNLHLFPRKLVRMLERRSRPSPNNSSRLMLNGVSPPSIIRRASRHTKYIRRYGTSVTSQSNGCTNARYRPSLRPLDVLDV